MVATFQLVRTSIRLSHLPLNSRLYKYVIQLGIPQILITSHGMEELR